VPSEFMIELEQLLNKHSKERGSGTPDYILARYLAGCLANYDQALQDRARWYGRTIQGMEKPDEKLGMIPLSALESVDAKNLHVGQ